jgi:uncharacterized protein (DUF924 family)
MRRLSLTRCVWPACRTDGIGHLIRYIERIVSRGQLIPESVDPEWVGEVLRFWFEDIGKRHWFTRNDQVDSQILQRFLTLHTRLAGLDGIGMVGPRQILAAIVVLDQFSRNLFRDSHRAFSADPIARRLSRSALEQSFDIAMKPEERYFLYLPFEHSEDPQDQALAVNLISALGNESWTRSAIDHKAIVDRFGRFPHRNSVLNRVSTTDETEFLNRGIRY